MHTPMFMLCESTIAMSCPNNMSQHFASGLTSVALLAHSHDSAVLLAAGLLVDRLYVAALVCSQFVRLEPALVTLPVHVCGSVSAAPSPARGHCALCGVPWCTPFASIVCAARLR